MTYLLILAIAGQLAALGFGAAIYNEWKLRK